MTEEQRLWLVQEPDVCSPELGQLRWEGLHRPQSKTTDSVLIPVLLSRVYCVLDGMVLESLLA